MTVTAEALQEALANCTGSENTYRHGLARTIHYTDGVKLFAEMAKAYWFLDMMAIEVARLLAREAFIHVVLRVADNKATAVADDGNGNEVWRRDIPYTDCPAGEWRFYVTDDTILLPSEY